MANSGTELGKAYVQIIPSAQGIKAKMQEILGDEMPSGEEHGKNYAAGLVSAIKTAIAAAGIGVALKTAITEGAALEQSLGGIETLFKDSADIVVKNAQQAYKTAGVSANTYMENVTSFSASLLQGLGGDTAKAAEIADMAMRDMSDNVNKFGSDAESVRNAYQGFAKDNFTMLDNLKLGYGGTKTEMARLINDSGVLGDTLVTVGQKGNFDEVVSFDKMIEAVNVVQGKLGITGTTAAEASTTISGAFASMKAAAQDFAGYLTLGMDITPAIQNLVSTASTFLFGNLFPALGNIFTALPGAISTFVSTAGTAISQNFSAGMLQGAVDSAAQFINGLGQGIQQNMPTFLAQALPMVLQLSEQLRANAGQLVDAGLNLIIQLAQGIADSLPTLITYIPQIVTNIAGIINDNAPKLLITAGTVIFTLARGLIQAIPTLIANIPQIIQAIVAVFTAFNWVNLGKTVLTAIKNGITDMPETLRSIASNAVNKIKSAFSGGGIGNVASNVFNGVKSVISNGMNAAKSTVTGVLDAIKGAFSNKLNAAKNVVSAVIDKIKGLFKFSWSLPSLKLPHIRYSIIDVPVLGKIPDPRTLHVSWYRKAMGKAMLLDSPTIFGMMGSKFLGGGEAGNEFVVGQSLLQKTIASAVDNQPRQIIHNVTFNSPKALSRREMRRKIKNDIREMAIYV